MLLLRMFVTIMIRTYVHHTVVVLGDSSNRSIYHDSTYVCTIYITIAAKMTIMIVLVRIL